MDNTVVRSEIDELRSVRRQITAWRWVLTVVLFATVLICVNIIADAVSGLARDGERRNQFVQALGAKMQSDVLPSVQEVGTEALRRIDFNKQVSDLNKRTPDVANATVKELNKLTTDIPVIGKKALEDEFKNALEQKADTLAKEFPDYSEEDIKTFLGAMTDETQTQLGEITDTLFAKHFASMENMVADLDKIAASEGNAAKAEIPTWDMIVLIADIARADFDTDTANTNAAPAGKGKK